jgi:hypothetical protein
LISLNGTQSFSKFPQTRPDLSNISSGLNRRARQGPHRPVELTSYRPGSAERDRAAGADNDLLPLRSQTADILNSRISAKREGRKCVADSLSGALTQSRYRAANITTHFFNLEKNVLSVACPSRRVWRGARHGGHAIGAFLP